MPGLDLVAIDVDEQAAGVYVRTSQSSRRVGRATVRQLHGEEAFAADRDVEFLLGQASRCPEDMMSGRRRSLPPEPDFVCPDRHLRAHF